MAFLLQQGKNIVSHSGKFFQIRNGIYSYSAQKTIQGVTNMSAFAYDSKKNLLYVTNNTTTSLINIIDVQTFTIIGSFSFSNNYTKSPLGLLFSLKESTNELLIFSGSGSTLNVIAYDLTNNTINYSKNFVADSGLSYVNDNNMFFAKYIENDDSVIFCDSGIFLYKYSLSTGSRIAKSLKLYGGYNSSNSSYEYCPNNNCIYAMKGTQLAQSYNPNTTGYIKLDANDLSVLNWTLKMPFGAAYNGPTGSLFFDINTSSILVLGGYGNTGSIANASIRSFNVNAELVTSMNISLSGFTPLSNLTLSFFQFTSGDIPMIGIVGKTQIFILKQG